MSADTFWQWWAFLLNLSKVQLILLGLGLALLVAVSKIFRFLFLLGALVVFLTVLLPAGTKFYEQSPVRGMVHYLWNWGVAATQDPEPPAEAPEKTPQVPPKEQR
ncbi:MAG: hypothetical protein AB7G75_26780 [Candidatus Binatia bacterium]